VSTLVCDPHIQIIPQLARAFGGFVKLGNAPAEYSAGVGNMDKDYVSWMVYNYAVQQSHDFVGRFRPYLFFGVATGAATLDSDPNNLVGGTVPKSTTEISHILVDSFSICFIFGERGSLWLNYRMHILDLQVNLG
jgi:hypothetical protein